MSALLLNTVSSLGSLPPIPRLRTPLTPTISVRASSKYSETTSTTVKQDPESSTAIQTFTAPPNFKPPEPKRFGVRPDKGGEIFGASLGLFFRLGTGVFASGYSASFVPKNEFPPDQYALEVAGFKVKETSKLGLRPEKPIEIYEFESCPFCRKVDPNTGAAMYESDAIIKYLVEKYGDGKVPFMLSLGLLTTLTEGLAMLGRMGKGSKYLTSRLPPQPINIWAYEGSPFCKIVREALVELELPHILCSCARGSPKRQILFERTGHFQVPYIDDPNTGVQMFESAEIVEYLRATYALQ